MSLSASALTLPKFLLRPTLDAANRIAGTLRAALAHWLLGVRGQRQRNLHDATPS